MAKVGSNLTQTNEILMPVVRHKFKANKMGTLRQTNVTAFAITHLNRPTLPNFSSHAVTSLTNFTAFAATHCNLFASSPEFISLKRDLFKHGAENFLKKPDSFDFLRHKKLNFFFCPGQNFTLFRGMNLTQLGRRRNVLRACVSS